MACCDPAASLLASEYARVTGFRLLVLQRSSLAALDLLKRGIVHLAGVHLESADDPDGNAAAAKRVAGAETTLVRVARWQEGLAVSPQVRVRHLREMFRNRLRWIGREPGSGARQCLDTVLDKRLRPRRIAYDHRGVAEAVRCGWADVGVCHRLVSEEAGLRFFGVREESYDLCFKTNHDRDPRLQGFLRVLRSTAYRKLLTELPGYNPRSIGQMRNVV
jgi:molybdate-binding protein